MVTYEQIMATDPYNTAYKYLANKFGTKTQGYTCDFSYKLRKCSNLKQRAEMEATATDKQKNLILNPVDEEHECMLLLLKQFTLGIEPKKELYSLLVSKGIILE